MSLPDEMSPLVISTCNSEVTSQPWTGNCRCRSFLVSSRVLFHPKSANQSLSDHWSWCMTWPDAALERVSVCHIPSLRCALCGTERVLWSVSTNWRSCMWVWTWEWADNSRERKRVAGRSIPRLSDDGDGIRLSFLLLRYRLVWSSRLSASKAGWEEQLLSFRLWHAHFVRVCATPCLQHLRTAVKGIRLVANSRYVSTNIV